MNVPLFKSKLFVIVFTLIYILIGINASVYPVFDKKRLFNNAESVGYGYKTANLIELNNAITENEKMINTFPGGFGVKVPDFLGLTSNQVEQALQTQGIDLKKQWNTFLTKHVKNQAAFINSKTLPFEWVKDLFGLAGKVEKAFTHISLNEKTKKFLKQAAQNNYKLMVRSTGKEDTDDIVNAGGNESVANVLPHEKNVLSAIGKVIASYFKKTSLQQRIDAQDKTIFNLPLTPFLFKSWLVKQKI